MSSVRGWWYILSILMMYDVENKLTKFQEIIWHIKKVKFQWISVYINLFYEIKLDLIFFNILLKLIKYYQAIYK